MGQFEVDVDVVVVGAGVVGLACAARLAHDGRSVLVIERHASPGQETSSRNSGVIHAGIYYPRGSHKAQLCAEGRDLLYARCHRHGIPHQRTGKLIVACDDSEIPALENLQSRARLNGVELTWLDAAEVRDAEPEVRAVAALRSDATGIVDAHALVADYQRELREHGGDLCLHTEVTAIRRGTRNWHLETRDTRGSCVSIESRFVVNAAGLGADRVAALAGLDVDALGLRLHWCKGDYFALSPAWTGRVRQLVYPLPVHAGLGIHLTLDLAGQLIAGPDTEYVDALDYRVVETKRDAFAAALNRYLPGLQPDDLQAGYAGIRPKLQGPEESFRDFVIEDAGPHDLPGLINLLGIESPGLTASEAIARRVCELTTT